ncbi:MAG: Fic/DOC family N-terminal domain-containing protein [Leptospirales bacterium]
MDNFRLTNLPPAADLETLEIMKALNRASRSLAELKGEAKTIPNERILINTLSLQEAKDSSAIENIITTNDELFRASVDESFKNLATKEVQNYSEALKYGFKLIKKFELLTTNHIAKIHENLEPNKKGFRKIPGTALKNDITGETVYTPPQNHTEIINLMSNLEKYINDDGLHNIDPLLKMGIIHFQFESIHPFYDGNGRTGRIINILYLVLKDLLDIPVLYLSRYIKKNKGEYYRLLQNVRDKEDWAAWLIWLLNGVTETSMNTMIMIREMNILMNHYKKEIKEKYKFYSQDLINNLFAHPYTKIEFIENDLKVHRNTAMSYLNELCAGGYLIKTKFGISNYYINEPLFNLLKGD